MWSKIRSSCLRVTQNVINRIKSYKEECWGDTDQGVYLLLLLMAGLLGGVSFLTIGIPKWLAFIVFGLLSVVICAAAIEVLSFFIKIILYKGVKPLLTMILVFFIIFTFAMMACMDIVSEGMGVLTAVVVFLVAVFFARSLYALLHNRKRRRSTLVICLCSGLLLAGIMVFLFGEGFKDVYVKEYLKLGKTECAKNAEGLKKELESGALEVGMIDYGVEHKRVKPAEKKGGVRLESRVFNMTPYVGGYEGFEAKYRELYQGYDIRHVPLAGRIWYPKEGKNYPVLFIIHGNHNFTTESYLGYDYLGKYLASHGYVVVSVDENFCNGNLFGNLKEENDGRAVLLLENIEQVLTYNKENDNPLYEKLDEANIAIAGHSRGGEAVAAAAYFNTVDNYPEDGTIPFQYHFAIKSVIAIAPTVDQYKPADRSVELWDVNYLLLQGANDQDVSVFMGAKQYNNVSFTDGSDYFKSYLYITGANHGQFNTLWGKYDLPSPISEILNVENLMPKKQQQSILKIFAKKFLDVTLKADNEYKELFYNVQKYRKVVPETVYIQSYMDSSYDMICDFEEDLDLTTGTMEGTSIDVSNVDTWTEKLSRFSNSEMKLNQDDYALSLKWNYSYRANAVVSLPSYNAEGKKLSFDIMDMNNVDVKEENYNLLDCTIVLADANHKQATAILSEHCTVYPPLPVRLSKLQFIFRKNEYKHQFQTVSIPIAEFEEEEGFDAGRIVKVQFLFDKDNSGNVRIDDIAFTD